jgi:hypothetical protein
MDSNSRLLETEKILVVTVLEGLIFSAVSVLGKAPEFSAKVALILTR